MRKPTYYATDEELVELYIDRLMSTHEIARKHQCSNSYVYNRLKKAGVKFRRRGGFRKRPKEHRNVVESATEPYGEIGMNPPQLPPYDHVGMIDRLRAVERMLKRR